jgi:alkyl sulfatase BDS1-like metallo-beta-lactamase superfamily hydrolase
VSDLYTGWFNGEAEDLVPVTKDELATNMLNEFGSERLLTLARKAYNSGDYRWALTLSSYVWRAQNKPQNEALYWRTQSMKRLAEDQMAIQWRHYLYSTAIIDWGFVPASLNLSTYMFSKPFYAVLHSIDNCFELMAIHVDSAKAVGLDQTIELSLTDDPDLPANQVGLYISQP